MSFLPAAWRTYSWCRTSSCSGHVVGLVSHVAGLSIHVQGLGLPVAWRSALVIAIITMVLRTDLVCNLAASRFSSALVRKRRGTLYPAPPDLFALPPCHTNRSGPDCDSHDMRTRATRIGTRTKLWNWRVCAASLFAAKGGRAKPSPSGFDPRLLSALPSPPAWRWSGGLCAATSR